MNNNFNETMKFEPPKENVNEAKEIILNVFSSLEEKGYDPINQVIGYILSGDPTYITSYNNARSMIRKIERDELLEELLKSYLKYEK
ncbi:IreB family regulatory phosphoprotein [Tissierella simiarum]